MLLNYNNIVKEVTCQKDLGGVITSGGGFSTYFPTPTYQLSQVQHYLSHAPPAAPGYNPKGRGIPDISLLGANYPVYIRGNVYTLFGTSASSPVFGAFITLINTQRYQLGLPSIGFLNPLLYAANRSYFNDITSGSNYCAESGCCKSGFNATVGWDPVSSFECI